MQIDYRTARLLGSAAAAGEAWKFTDRDLVGAIQEMQNSRLHGLGLPTFDSELAALYAELESRIEGTDP